MALKVRCPYCDEQTTFDAKTDTYNCQCGTTVKLPAGKLQSDPYSDWGDVYQDDMQRKRPDAHNTPSKRGRKQKKKVRPPSWGGNYGDC